MNDTDPGPQEFWFYMQGSSRVGPVTLAAVAEAARSRVLHPDALVWMKGMPAWVPARTSALRSLWPDEPPPLPLAAVRDELPPPLPKVGTPVRKPKRGLIAEYLGPYGRIGRGAFLLRQAGACAACFVIAFLWALFTARCPQLASSEDLADFSYVLGFVGAYLFLVNVLKRLTDLGKSAAWLLLIIVPFGIILLAIILIGRPGVAAEEIDPRKA